MASGCRWRVQPDQQMVIGDELVDVVSRDAMVGAIMDAEALLARRGGMFTAVTRRRRTDLEGEAVTIFAVIEWKPGTRAVVDDEDDALPLAAAAPQEPLDEPTEDEEHDLVVNTRTGEVLKVESVPADDIGDGLDPATLEDEDVSEIPAGLR